MKSIAAAAVALATLVSLAAVPAQGVGGSAQPQARSAVTVADGIDRFQTCTAASPQFASMEFAPENQDGLPQPARMVRLWDMKTSWRDINPSSGTFDWTVLDQRVAQAERSGAGVLLVLGLTPQWAAADPAAGDARWGAGSASPPADINTYRAYVDAVAARYGGRIGAYEVWNEANLRTFWTGTPQQMADLTAAAYQAVKAHSPGSKVILPSVTTRLPHVMEVFVNPFLDALAQSGNTFDAFTIHSYPAGNAGPDRRVADVNYYQSVVVRKVGADSPLLDRPLWDTEVNYGLAGPGATPGTAYSDADGAALLTRTYDDSARLGIDATFWYMYTVSNFPLLGVQFNPGTPVIARAWNAMYGKFSPGANRCAELTSTGGGGGTAAPPIQPPVLKPGEGKVLINGVEVPVIIRQDGGTRLIITGPGFVITLDAKGPDGSQVPLAPDGSLVLAQGGPLKITFDGLAPGTYLTLYIFSDPQLLGIVPVGATGTVRTTTTVPAGTPPGTHTLEAQATTAPGQSLTLFLSSTVKSPAAAKGARPAISMRIPAVKSPGSKFTVSMSGVQVRCPVTVTIKGSFARAIASTLGKARLVLTAPTTPGNYPVVARVSGSGCDPVSVQGITKVQVPRRG